MVASIGSRNAVSRILGSARSRTLLASTLLLLGLGLFLASDAPAQGLNADLSITKSDSPDPVAVNQDLTYTLVVTNSGPAAATGVTVTDNLPGSTNFVSASAGCTNASGTVTCNVGTLQPADNPLTPGTIENQATITIVVRPTSTGVIVNDASVDGNETDPTPGNNSADEPTTVTASNPDLSLAKTDSADPVTEDDQFSYTLTATNVTNAGDGTDNASGVTITDTLPAGVSFVSASSGCSNASGTVTCNIGSIDEGASAMRTITVTANQPGTLNNTATISGAESDPIAGNNSASQTTQVVAPDLALTKTDSADPVTEGNNFDYVLTVTNNGNPAAGTQNASGVTITDNLPIGVTFVSASAGCSNSSGTVTCNVGSLADGASAMRTITVRPTSPGTVTNTASVAGNQQDPSTADNSDSESTMIVASNPDLAISKSDSPDPVAVNGNLVYTLVATNTTNGPTTDDATGVTITDNLPGSVTFISASAGCTNSGGTVTCAVGNLAEGSSATRTITVRPRTAGTISNTASVDGDQADPVSANDSDTEQTTVNAASTDLALDKSDSPDPVAENDNLTYTLTATNNGPNNATGVTVTDPLPGSVSFVSASSGCSNASGTVTCNVGDLDNGQSAQRQITVRPRTPGTISNTASVTGAETDPTPGNNDAGENTVVQASNPDLSVSKADSPDPIVEEDLLTYTLTITNVTNAGDGTDNATGVTVTDTLPGSVNFVDASPGCSNASGTVTCNVGDLDEGQSVIRQISVRPQSPGSITNNVSVSGGETDPVPGNNSDSESTTVTASADLAITKADSPDPIRAGGQLTYTLTVTNNGPSNATGVTITDTLPGSVTFESASSGCSNASGTVTCTVGNLAQSASSQRQIVVRPQTAGTITNTASVDGSEPDASGSNDSDSENTTVTSRIAPPTINDTDPNSPANDNNPEVKGTAESGSTVKIFSTSDCSGTPLATGSAATFTGAGITVNVPDNSTTMLRATATDGSGNPPSDCSAPFEYREDSNPPDTTITSGPVNQVTTDSTPTFEFTSSENGSSFECRVDGEAFGACSGPGASHTTSQLADGNHTFEVRATDGGGNVDGSAASAAFFVSTAQPGDTTPPETSIAKDLRKTTDKTPTFRFSSNEAGSSFKCRVDGGGFKKCTSPFTTKKLGKGRHTFKVRATDASGNVDASPAKDKFKVTKKN